MQGIQKFIYEHKWILLILICATVLIFKNLGNIYLWEDEAGIALIARNILKFGIPEAWDGNNLVVDAYEPLLAGDGFNDKFIITTNPWAPYYLVALAFKMLGESTFSARLPFASLGLLTILFLYKLVLLFTKDKLAAILSALILALSIQFILYSRQCHYYTLISFLEVMVLYSFRDITKKTNLIIFIVASILLFHSHFLPFLATFLALSLYVLCVDRNRKFLIRYGCSLCIIFLFTFPWLHYAKDYRLISGLGRTPFTLKEYPISVLCQVLESSYVFPLPGLICLFALLNFKKSIEKYKLTYILIGLLIGTHWILASSILRPSEIIHSGIRHIADIIPLSSFVFGVIFAEFIRSYLKLGLVLFTFFLFTNLFGNNLSLLFHDGFTIYETRENPSYFLKHSSIEKIETSLEKNIRICDFKIKKISRKALFAHPLTKITYKPIFVPPNTYLSFGIGIDPQVWSTQKGDGVLFEIYLRRTSSNNEELFFSKYIDPKNIRTDRKWHDELVDLSKFSDELVVFTFLSTAGPKNDINWDWAGWAEPAIMSKEDKVIWKRFRKKKFLDLVLKTEYLKFIYEITHDYVGPIEGIVKFLRTHAKSTDIIYTNYESKPIQFYTNLRQAGKIMRHYRYFYKVKDLPAYISSLTEVDWFILRRNKFFVNAAKDTYNYFSQNDKLDKVYKIKYPNLPWENLPASHAHLFETLNSSNRAFYYYRKMNELDEGPEIFRYTYPDLEQIVFKEAWEDIEQISIFKIK